jgi:hypothetical protein
MAPPYRDVRPRIEWTQTLSERQVLVALSFGDYADVAAYFADGWRLKGDTQGSGFPVTIPAPATDSAFGGWWSATVGGSGLVVTLSGSVTFWIDDPGGPPFTLGPLIRETWMEKTFTGLPASSAVGVRIRANWSLDTGFGNLFLEIDGTSRLSYPNGLFDLWTIPNDLALGLTDYYLVGLTNGLGELTVKIGGEDFQTSGNILATFHDIEIVDFSCSPSLPTHELRFKYPIEDVRSFRQPRAGSHLLTFPSGEADAWLRGHDGHLRGEVRWIDTVSELTPPENDGWEDVDDAGTPRYGWARFVRHARQGGTFTFFPDENDDTVSYPCVWAGDPPEIPTHEVDFERMLPFRIRTTDGSLIEGYSQ